jgi:holo-ACP synthase CitX
MPGDVKRNHQSLAVAHAAVEALRKAFSDEIEERDLETGYEAYLLTPIPQLEAKRRVCNIEEEHPLGRLFDLDVITPEGTPIPRSAINRPPRQCLLCQQEARFCMRNHTHTREELQQRIDEMVTEFMREKK